MFADVLKFGDVGCDEASAIPTPNADNPAAWGICCSKMTRKGCLLFHGVSIR